MNPSLIPHIRTLLQGPLPGEPAQHKMAPISRQRTAQALKEDKAPRQGAVLLLLFPVNDVLHTVLMLRPEYEGTHSGQVSFPGGKLEPEDDSLLHTALREAEEEAAIPRNKVEVLGQLSQLYIPPSRFLVSPYVGYVDLIPQFIPDPIEVQRLITVPLPTLLDDRIVGQKKIAVMNGAFTINSPVFTVDGETVWGATAMIISEFKELVRGL